jgi:5-methylcytosine-specific restriction endonuclease McrA
VSKSKIPLAQRARVAEAAGYQCGYCQTQEIVIGMPLVIDHIIPEIAGGTSEDQNLWLACRRCNEFKGAQTSATDPETGEQMPLFNPRTLVWSTHFVWREGVC